MRFFKIIFVILSILFLIEPNILFSQDSFYKGSIKGRITDKETREVLIGVNVIVKGTKMGNISDENGIYEIKNVLVGTYSLEFRIIGYEKSIKTDIVVFSERITVMDVELEASFIKEKEVVIEGKYFDLLENQPTSSISFSSEEIRRAPGAAGDVSRIIYGLPSLAKVQDNDNGLLVRGGSVTENLFLIDNIEIPNINHFPSQGSTGGPIGLLNVDFIKDINFNCGGFSSIYGDKLSSVMNISLREGNMYETNYQLTLDLAGVGAQAEGPIGNGSWLFSARKSYLDFLVKSINQSVNYLPEYSDFQTKIIFNLSPNQKIIFLDVLGIDDIGIDKENAIKEKQFVYGDNSFIENTTGINWFYQWGKGYSNTSFSHTFNKYEQSFFETHSDQKLATFDVKNHEFKLRNVNYWKINNNHRLEFGFDLKLLKDIENKFFGAYTNLQGAPTPEYIIKRDESALKTGIFLSYSFLPNEKLTMTPSIRVDNFSYNKHTLFSPRYSISYKLSDLSSISGSIGLYYQNIPMVLLSQNIRHKDLKDMKAIHYIAGFNHLLNENTNLIIEIYSKEYSDFPMDPNQPKLFIIDEISYFGNLYLDHEFLNSAGKAYTRGIELTIQKKLAEKLYGIISGSYFRSRYCDINGDWTDRIYDNKFMFTIDGGYKLDDRWEFSLRWIFAGGIPYTPFNIEASEEAHRGIFDNDNINKARKPDYHSLSIRADRRFYFSKSSLIVYLSIWNLYGRKNIATYYWNGINNKIETSHQWGTMPVLGVEFKF